MDSVDKFLCPCCKKVFSDPVTTACGHSFCKICINKYWDNCDPCHCPVCDAKFRSRPKLKTSTFVSEMVSEFKHKRQRESAGPETSEPNPKVKKFQENMENMEERTCPEHGKPFMELFCRDHSQLICIQCFSAHQKHNIVTLMDQCKDQQSELQQKIQEREVKIQELQRSVELSQENADREMKEGVEFFNDLMKSVQQSLDQFKKSINKKHHDVKKKAEVLIKEIKSEISVLQQRQAQMQVMWSSDDYYNFVQTFALKPAPKMNDWTKESVRAPTYHGRVAIAVSELQVKKINPKIKEKMTDELKQANQHAADVTLDPDTAHRNLVVSKDNKEVFYSNQTQELPNTLIGF
uniref:Uncharacterized protein n=1 Tax=Neogobius melanostomus TaxID=47308 RepID=A0A8C6URJ9_9GOBI